ncbi:metal transporter [Flavobacterium psychrophilum]|uniref:HMA domain-containing protein n=1 Tax=Flavobacterium psychrophilum (strain ATCC 49511 / DSM 21280 / CIP 103535 / JIP02/86) TaxID=402612 RepID=A6H171_FLAPJ|nr:cation transporter [Flavobacterium psychrophilum]AIG30780.1 metal transporter [Flavobacterium psychrophilum]AIG33053.1 metal transporter [Flavobacterium psychrophilum]AIG35210.1 metal transporter [Flavobacterium psychrophilum]AIG37574.1 metal transporter [Flavobacterium psychrophilum]AIG39839.1 metal transporter [Flavobacterium psychrophilum]
MKNIILILMVSFLGLSMNAQEVKKNKNAQYTIEVNGNCKQCQKRIQKAALSVSGVKQASWSIETHRLKFILNEEKNTVVNVEKAIAKVGHDTEAVKANINDYDNLHTCCKYER